MSRHQIAPKRSLGQNFVVDPSTVRLMARLSGAGVDDHVLEIGAGLGSLTLALAETGASVRAVEVDDSCVEALQHLLTSRGLLGDLDTTHDNRNSVVEVVQQDARQLDLETVLAGAKRWILVANLPYNIATPLVLDLLRTAPAIESMVVMVQREVAERLAAPPGSRARGIPSVRVERLASAEVLAEVSPSAFYPRPEVVSAVVRISRHNASAVTALTVQEETRFDCLLRTGFGQRRKMLRRSLAGLVNSDGFKVARLDPTCRPETLTLQQWLKLAQHDPALSSSVSQSRFGGGSGPF